jgi:hypothetical protein
MLFACILYSGNPSVHNIVTTCSGGYNFNKNSTVKSTLGLSSGLLLASIWQFAARRIATSNFSTLLFPCARRGLYARIVCHLKDAAHDKQLFTAVSLLLAFSLAAQSESNSSAPNSSQKETLVTTRATGPFDVKIAPLDPAFKTEANSLGPISIDKQYHGDLDATGKGEMLTGGTAIKVSGVCVAVERVAGTLHGRSGTFLLQHSGVMTRGTPHLSITVVANSGTGQLTGLTGTMNVITTDGKHSYDFSYSLPAAK